KTAAYGELAQQTHVEAGKVNATVADALDATHAAVSVLATADSRPSAAAGLKSILADHQSNITAVFSAFVANGFDGKDAAGQGAAATDKDGSCQPVAALGPKGITVSASAGGAKGAVGYVAHPLSGVQEPSAYQGTMYVTYEMPVHRGGKLVGYAGVA